MTIMKFIEHKGRFFKHCPCTPGAVSCGYYNANLHTGCPYDCTYCILQAYLESKEPVFFGNWHDLERELEEAAQNHRCIRIGSGELTDSLALGAQSNYSQEILQLFEKFPDIVFEFKTKSANIKNLLACKKVLANIVVSWSLNPQQIIAREEAKTPALADRIEALAALQARGYRIGIHFDPIIFCRDWQELYERLIREIARVIEPGKIAWWSLGALRFPAELRGHIFKHKDSRLFDGELVKGCDGKYRYFKPLRMELFRFMIERIHAHISGETPLYLCMEDAEVWQELLPQFPAEEQEINKYLYQSVWRKT